MSQLALLIARGPRVGSVSDVFESRIGESVRTVGARVNHLALDEPSVATRPMPTSYLDRGKHGGRATNASGGCCSIPLQVSGHLSIAFEFSDDRFHAGMPEPGSHRLVVVLSKKRLTESLVREEQGCTTLDLLLETRGAKRGRVPDR